MAWRDNLREAAFRNAVFHTRSSTRGVGRRNVLHQFPGSEVPYAEDMGLEADEFTVVGYVIQDVTNGFDYFDARDLLMEALREPGSGILVHPYYGEIEVVLRGRAQITETSGEGGMARFQMVFALAGEPRIPSAIPDDKGLMASAVEAAQETLRDKFAEIYDPEGPGFLTSVAGALGDAQEAMNMVNSTVRTVQSRVVSAITKSLTTITSLKNSLDDIMDAPDQLATAITNSLNIFSDLIPFMSTEENSPSTRTATGTTTPTGLGTAPSLTSEPLKSTSLVTAVLQMVDYGAPLDEAGENLYGGTLPEIPETTDSRTQQIANRNAMEDLVRGAAIAEAVNVAVNMDYATREEAQEIQDNVVVAMDTVLNDIGANSKNDETYKALQELKPLFITAMENKGAALPPTRELTVPPAIRPSLIYAYDLYEDLGREDEIILKNPTPMLYPGFPAGGEVLEVLSE